MTILLVVWKTRVDWTTMHQHFFFVICVCRDDIYWNYYNDKHSNCVSYSNSNQLSEFRYISELRVAIMMSIVWTSNVHSIYIWMYCLLVSGPTTCAHMQSSGTQATSVKAAVLAGLGIAASIFLLTGPACTCIAGKCNSLGHALVS